MTRRGRKKKANNSEKNSGDASTKDSASPHSQAATVTTKDNVSTLSQTAIASTKDNASADSETATASSKDNAFAYSQTATASNRDSVCPHSQTGTASIKKSKKKQLRRNFPPVIIGTQLLASAESEGQKLYCSETSFDYAEAKKQLLQQIEKIESTLAESHTLKHDLDKYKTIRSSSQDEKQNSICFASHVNAQISSKNRHILEPQTKSENSIGEDLTLLREDPKVESQKERDGKRRRPSIDNSDRASAEVKERHGLDCSDASLKNSSEGNFISSGITEAELQIVSNPETRNNEDSTRPVIFTRDKSTQTDILPESPIASELIDSDNNMPLGSSSDCNAVAKVPQPDLFPHKESNEENIPDDVALRNATGSPFESLLKHIKNLREDVLKKM